LAAETHIENQYWLFLFLLKVAIFFSIGNICSFPYVVKIGYFGCRNSYCGLTRSHRGATYSSPEPCWYLTYFSRPFCSKGLVPDNYFWYKLALNRQKKITGGHPLNKMTSNQSYKYCISKMFLSVVYSHKPRLSH
jgi:hypothetical protein